MDGDTVETPGVPDDSSDPNISDVQDSYQGKIRPNRDRVRPAVRALIVQDGKLLVTVNTDTTHRFLLLPGGGQQFGEDAIETVKRECREELDCEVSVGDVVAIRDYIGSRHEFADWDSHYHQIEMMFEATLAPGSTPRMVGDGDTFQIGVEWIPIAEMADAPLYPAELKQWLQLPPDERPVYLGSVN